MYLLYAVNLLLIRITVEDSCYATTRILTLIYTSISVEILRISMRFAVIAFETSARRVPIALTLFV